jgi:hypothetical protein
LQVGDVTTSKNDELVALIEELEQKMPTSIQVLTFSATDEGITMNITLDSKAAAADVISQLRTFSSIESESIAISTIADTQDESGIGTVSLSVTCNYREQEDSEMEGVAADADSVDAGTEVTE